MKELSPSFNVNNGNCVSLLREIGIAEEEIDCCGTFTADEIPAVRVMVATAIENTTSDYFHKRLVQLHEILTVAEYLGYEVSWG
jgi:hypothetical protein